MATFEFVQHRVTQRLRSEAVAFWVKEGAMPESAAEQRAPLLLAVARGDSGEIIAVATGTTVRPHLISQPLMNYRTFVGANHRRRGLARDLLMYCFDHIALHERAAETPHVLGLLLVYPNELADYFGNALLWPQTQFAFVGRAETDELMRVRYFDDVRLQ